LKIEVIGEKKGINSKGGLKNNVYSTNILYKNIKR
jgi:hypothetical protein